jgi:uncharacterized protein
MVGAQRKKQGSQSLVFPSINMPTTTTLSFLKKYFIIVCCGQPIFGLTQKNSNDCVWSVFQHENGVVASEGCLVDGQPEGIWSSYSNRGVLLSQGERRNQQPHGKWFFYTNGKLSEATTFDQGIKSGVQVLWDNELLTDSLSWMGGTKEGRHVHFHPNGKPQWELFYEKNKREGKSVQFNFKGFPHGFRWFKNDRLVASESFNRFDDSDRKTGPWKVFHASGRVMETGFFKEGRKHGFFQYFDARGSVVEVLEYNMGTLVVETQEAAPQILVQETRRADGTLASTTTYRDGVKDGVSRSFNVSGIVIGGAVFAKDELVAEGITQLNGKKDGTWETYWPNGKTKTSGTYKNDERVGLWMFFRENGDKEQEGKFNGGRLDGLWTWWHITGEIHRKEEYNKGVLNGMFVELDTLGQPLVEGRYERGEREGFWRISVNDDQIEGRYLDGEKDSVWTESYGDGSPRFRGEYAFGQPVGKHKYWHPSGSKEEEGKYESGVKHKKWRVYNQEGVLLHEYLYKYGKLRRIDGSKVDRRRDGKLKR